jgi:hypothetical protein
MQYETMREWRDIAEFLYQQPYKFIDDDQNDFTLLSPLNKPHREQLWSLYMLQFCQFCPHPYSFYHRVPQRDIPWGWRLLPDWEDKINFLEQIALFDRNPDDLLQPWRARIWQAMLKRRAQESEQSFVLPARGSLKRQEYQARLLNGDCPAGFDCKSMCGVEKAASCDNMLECGRIMQFL